MIQTLQAGGIGFPFTFDKTPTFEKVLPKYRSRKTMLPANFKPLPYSVVMGRGKDATNAVGNRRLKIIVETQLEKYVQAKSRREKSWVVAHVLETVQDACPVGAFVKHDGEHWWEVDDNAAREKIGSMFRDHLHQQYKSSTKSKMARRRATKKRGSMNSVSTASTTPSVDDLSEMMDPLVPLDAFSQPTADLGQLFCISNLSDALFA